jgi:hypothetical protein
MKPRIWSSIAAWETDIAPIKDVVTAGPGELLVEMPEGVRAIKEADYMRITLDIPACATEKEMLTRVSREILANRLVRNLMGRAHSGPNPQEFVSMLAPTLPLEQRLMLQAVAASLPSQPIIPSWWSHAFIHCATQSTQWTPLYQHWADPTVYLLEKGVLKHVRVPAALTGPAKITLLLYCR